MSKATNSATMMLPSTGDVPRLEEDSKYQEITGIMTGLQRQLSGVEAEIAENLVLQAERRSGKRVEAMATALATGQMTSFAEVRSVAEMPVRLKELTERQEIL